MYQTSKWLDGVIDACGVPSAMSETVRWTRRLILQFGTLNHRALLWRRHCSELAERLRAEPEQRILLDGPTGTGKSATLLQLADYLVKTRKSDSKEMVIYLGRVGRWTAGYYPYQQSKTNPAEYLQPELATDIMRLLTISVHDTSPPSEANPEAAIDNLQRMLGLLAGDKERVLLLIDDLDALFAPTGYHDVDGNPLSVERMPVLRMMRSLFLDTKATIIAAHCRSNPALVDSRLNGTIFKASVERLSYFTAAEVQSVLDYYKALGHVPQEVSPKFAQKIHFVSGGSAGKILPAAHYDSVYQRY